MSLHHVLSADSSFVPEQCFTGPKEGSVAYRLPRDQAKFGDEVWGQITQQSALELCSTLSILLGVEESIGTRVATPRPAPARDWSRLPLNAIPFYPVMSCGVLVGSQGDFYDAVKAENPKMGLAEFMARADEAEGKLRPEKCRTIDQTKVRMEAGRFSGKLVMQDDVLTALPREDDPLADGITLRILRVEWLASDRFPGGVWSVLLRNEKQNGTLVHLIMKESAIQSRLSEQASASGASCCGKVSRASARLRAWRSLNLS